MAVVIPFVRVVLRVGLLARANLRTIAIAY
jgi:hypothetical protein